MVLKLFGRLKPLIQFQVQSIINSWSSIYRRIICNSAYDTHPIIIIKLKRERELPSRPSNYFTENQFGQIFDAEPNLFHHLLHYLIRTRCDGNWLKNNRTARWKPSTNWTHSLASIELVWDFIERKSAIYLRHTQKKQTYNCAFIEHPYIHVIWSKSHFKSTHLLKRLPFSSRSKRVQINFARWIFLIRVRTLCGMQKLWKFPCNWKRRWNKEKKTGLIHRFEKDWSWNWRNYQHRAEKKESWLKTERQKYYTELNNAHHLEIYEIRKRNS